MVANLFCQMDASARMRWSDGQATRQSGTQRKNRHGRADHVVERFTSAQPHTALSVIAVAKAASTLKYRASPSSARESSGDNFHRFVR